MDTFTPLIESSLNKMDATKYNGDRANWYNSVPFFCKKQKPDLASYVTMKVTNALFDLEIQDEKYASIILSPE